MSRMPRMYCRFGCIAAFACFRRVSCRTSDDTASPMSALGPKRRNLPRSARRSTARHWKAHKGLLSGIMTGKRRDHHREPRADATHWRANLPCACGMLKAFPARSRFATTRPSRTQSKEEWKLDAMWSVLVTAGNEWLRHRDARLGAALAYYSSSPLGHCSSSSSTLPVCSSAARPSPPRSTINFAHCSDRQEVKPLKPCSRAPARRLEVRSQQRSALGVVAQLKDALNTIWETKAPEHVGLCVRAHLPRLVCRHTCLGFLLAVSLVINTALSGFSVWLGSGESLLWGLVNFFISLGVPSVLFAMLFKWFPHADVAWRDAWVGGLTTALLFNIGKSAISWYIERRAWSRAMVRPLLSWSCS